MSIAAEPLYYGYSSLDAAKAACCRTRKNGSHGYHNMDFRIYHNDSVILESAPKSGWRLRWLQPQSQSD